MSCGPGKWSLTNHVLACVGYCVKQIINTKVQTAPYIYELAKPSQSDQSRLWVGNAMFETVRKRIITTSGTFSF